MHSSVTPPTKNPAPQLWNDPLDLAKCDQEPVDTPGAIMPHGVMLLLSPEHYHILGASANIETWFACPVESLLGANLERIFPEALRQVLENSAAQLGKPKPPLYLGCFNTLKSEHNFDVFAHRSGEFLVLEFESLPADCPGTIVTKRFAEVSDSIAAVQAATTWQEGMNLAVQELKRLGSFDSVIGVRLLADGTGHAVAEAREVDFNTFLVKRFPYSDMPEPARRQMLLMPIQYAPQLEYDSVPLIMTDTVQNSTPINLGYSILRSVSRMCSRYYMNMGAQSRLLLVMVNQGKLWGFLSCLSSKPRQTVYADRLAFQSFTQLVTPLLVEKARAELAGETLQKMRKVTDLVAHLSSAPDFAEALDALPARLLETLQVNGAALCLNKHLITAGVTPDPEQIKILLPWLDQQTDLFSSDQLPALYAPATEYADRATGLFAARLLDPQEYLLVFRPEWVHEVRWAGDPQKPVEIDLNSGEHRLMPRGSFEVWKEVVRGRARPWQDCESEALGELQQSLKLLQLSDKRQSLTTSLQRSNADLENFAYVVSHDLQEPLRGIIKNAHLCKDTIIQPMESETLQPLDTVINLSTRMTDLIKAVLQYSRAGQEEVIMEIVNMNDLLQSVLESLSILIEESRAEVLLPRPLPTVVCDPMRTAAVLQNLISNAIKYNDATSKRIDIGYLDKPVLTFFVRDNGIGIPHRLQESIFTIFHRLHTRDAYGGGNGAGLTIARKHIEKQGGQLWLESESGQGSTFFFTLPRIER